MNQPAWRKFACMFCGHVYNEEKGDPKNNVKPGTRWEDVPDSWFCPQCGATKADFEQM